MIRNKLSGEAARIAAGVTISRGRFVLALRFYLSRDWREDGPQAALWCGALEGSP